MTPSVSSSLIQFGLPKGRMQEGVFALLRAAGVNVRSGSRGYRPSLSLPGYEVKILKPQNIVEMLHFGSRDVGFAGHDWVKELKADLVELLDTGLDPVRIVAAAPSSILTDGKLPNRPLVVASEYEHITKRWMEEAGLNATFVRSYGATEVFPPEDADCIVDNTATGSTLVANGLEIVETVMRSSTRLYAHPQVLENPEKKARIEELVLLLRSVLEARQRVMVEVNVLPENLEAVCKALPCMREPTISTLHGDAGHAIKAAVLRKELPLVIPRIKAAGGTDVVVYDLSQIVP